MTDYDTKLVSEKLTSYNDEAEKLTKEIAGLVRQLAETKKPDWSHVGSAAHAVEQLRDIHNFLNS